MLAAIGAGRALTGAIQANQAQQRNKGFINANYGLASRRLDLEQRSIGQSREESLAARGLLQGGNPGSAISAAMGSATPPTDLASQDVDYTREGFGLERKDLDLQHGEALAENKANYNNSLISSAMSGVGTALNLGNAAGEAGAGRTPSIPSPSGIVNPSGTPTPARHPSDYAFGVNPTEPLAPHSRWSIMGEGQPNYSFNVGNG